MSFRRSLMAVTMLAGMAANAQGMDFSRVVINNQQEVIVEATGDIVPGDDAKLHNVVAHFPGTDKIVALALSSNGGNIYAAKEIAETIKNTNLSTLIGNNGTCASACFMIFAAGKDKVLVGNGRVGVHSASYNGQDTTDAQAATTLTARFLTTEGVPPAILGKMVTTVPGEIYWLTHEDLESMGVVFVPYTGQQKTETYHAGSALVPGISQEPSTPETSVKPLVTESELTQGYIQGRADRIAYETWFNSLTGIAQEGAAWWAENRSRRNKGQKVVCDAVLIPMWVQGCFTASQMLNPSDKRRLAEPDYKAGWNSL